MLFLTLFAARTISPAAVVKRIGKEAQNEWWTIEGQHTPFSGCWLTRASLAHQGKTLDQSIIINAVLSASAPITIG